MADLKKVAIALIASADGLDVNSTTKQTIYIVPIGKKLIVTDVVVRNASASLTTASFGFGFNANADDVITDGTWTELTGNTLFTVEGAKQGAAVGNAGDTFGLKCSIAQGSAATVDVEIFGYLIDA